jgi:tRNA (guanine37-N1)-methyltransferase
MEVIAGNDLPGWSEVVVKEEGCSYHLDFQRVYWNSRLGREHQRIVQLIRKDHTTKVKIQRHKNETGAELAPIRTIVADMMAGIGPFAIPLTADSKITSQGRGGGKTDRKLAQAKDELGSRTTYSNGIVVYANDLNPDSYKYLVVNAEKNRCDVNEKLHTFNMDARAFCHKLQDDGIVVDHFIMNLPKTALEFLDAFRGYNVVTSTSKGADGAKTPNESGALPMIHVHCFASKDVNDSRNEIWGRCETALGCTIDQTKDQVTITEVRDVSPNKNMYCVSFRLPSSVRSLPRIVLGSHNNKNKSNQMDVDDGRSSSTPEPKRSKLS